MAAVEVNPRAPDPKSGTATLRDEGALFCPPLTDEQKEVLSKWGLSLKRSETGNVPTFAFRPVAEDAKYSQCHIYLFDMSQFSGNAHEWAQTKKSCKLTEL